MAHSGSTCLCFPDSLTIFYNAQPAISHGYATRLRGIAVDRHSASRVSPRTSFIPHRRLRRLVPVDTPGGDAAVPGPRFGKRLLFRHRGLLGWLVVIGLGIGGVSAWLLNRERGLVDRKPGQVVPDFAIPDVRTDQLHSLSQHRGQVVVIVFTGTACPVGELYMPRLSVIAQAFEMRDVDFLAINSNASDTAEDVAEHARRARVTFPVLKDLENRVADQLLAERTCEALVIDGRGRLCYRGAIDDQYELGTRRESPEHSYLVDAIQSVLAGREVTPATTPVVGCPIERVMPCGPSARRPYAAPRPGRMPATRATHRTRNQVSIPAR